jgi:outer membrane biosynthesis protein TonB
MKLLIIVLFFGFGLVLNAQEINFKGENYEVKKGKIFKEGVDVTKTLTAEDQEKIKLAFNEKKERIKDAEKAEKRLEKAEKEQKKAEKERKRAEKKQKQAEKELNKKEKAQSRYDKAIKKHKAAVKKYEQLKKKGKLSPVDEEKWLDKITKYKEASEKAERQLR